MRSLPRLLLGSLASFPFAVLQGQAADAQAPPAFTLSGFVHDDAQAPVSNAELKLERRGDVPRLIRTGSMAASTSTRSSREM